MTDGTSDTVGTLIDKAGVGNPGAVDALLKKYRPYLRIVAQKAMRQMFQQKFDASDAVQQTCLEAFDAIASFRGKTEDEFNAWLNTILQRNIINLMRSHTAQKRDVRRELPMQFRDSDVSLQWHMPTDTESGPESCMIRGEAALALAEAISNLTDGQRTAVQMRFLEGCKLAEIAAYMEITPPSVARLIERGIDALRTHLPKKYDPNVT